MLPDQALQNRLLHARRLHQRRVSLDDDIALLQPVDDIFPRAPRVDLVLADGDLSAHAAVDVLFQFVQMVDAVVRDSDGADLAGLLGLHEGTPGSQSTFLTAVGGVEKHAATFISSSYPHLHGIPEIIQVNVFNASSVRKTRLDRLLGLLIRHVSSRDLGRVEDLGAIDAGFPDGVDTLGFVLVVLRAVDLFDRELTRSSDQALQSRTNMAVSGLQGLQCHLLRDIGRAAQGQVRSDLRYLRTGQDARLINLREVSADAIEYRCEIHLPG